MAPELCDVCSQVPAWIESLSWETPVSRYAWRFDTRNEPELTLRSWKDMQSEAKNDRCDLCNMITMFKDRSSLPGHFFGYPNSDPRDDETSVNTPLTFWRDMAPYTNDITFQCVNNVSIFSGKSSVLHLHGVSDILFCASLLGTLCFILTHSTHPLT